MNVVIYCRFSSHSQNEQSIEGQLKVCYEYAERNGYTVIAEYIDRAISGKDAENRPEFQRMIHDSAKKQFSGVLVYQLDRFSRNRYDSANYKAKLKKNNVRVLSAKENISDDPSGILMESVLEGMAEYYSAELALKIKRGMNLNAEKHLSTGGGVALGYKLNDEKQFVIDDDTAPIVKKIFEMYIGGKSFAEIIRTLNSSGHRTSRGNEYNRNSIRRILQNRRYIGIYTYNGTDIPDGMPRIIDDEIFAKAQLQLERNKKAPSRNKAIGENYILTTKLFCGECATSIIGISGTAKSGKLHQYYQCTDNRKKKGCENKAVKKNTLEDLVVSEVVALLHSDKLPKIITATLKYSEQDSNTAAIKFINKQLKENETATKNLIKALESGKAVDIITEQIENRQAEKEQLKLDLAREKMLSQALDENQVTFFLNRLKAGDVNDINYRQSLVDMFIAKILLHKTKVEIICTFDGYKIEIPINELEGSFMGRLVEAGGVEPPSESIFTRTSPSADDSFTFPYGTVKSSHCVAQ